MQNMEPFQFQREEKQSPFQACRSITVNPMKKKETATRSLFLSLKNQELSFAIYLLSIGAFTYCALISMDMASKHDVNFGSIKCRLHGCHHFVTFPLVSRVAVVPRCMKHCNQPWRLTSIHFLQIRLSSQLDAHKEDQQQISMPY
jgi:hypothetical protein